MSTIAPEAGTLRQLPPEPWGRKMRRAREQVADLTLGEAAELASRFTLTDASTISRLESMTEPPTGARSKSQRQRAYILCLAYEVDPASLGLGPDDLLVDVVIPFRTPSDLREASTIWDTAPTLFDLDAA